jgi:hypothetical protein
MLIDLKNIRSARKGFAAAFNTVRRIAHFLNLRRKTAKTLDKSDVDRIRIKGAFGALDPPDETNIDLALYA